MTVKPLSDRVLVLPNPAETTTASGLIIPDSAKEKPAAGKVIAVGPGTAEIKMEVKVGDEVLYGKYAGTELNIDGESYLMMAQRDILAVVEKSTENGKRKTENGKRKTKLSSIYSKSEAIEKILCVTQWRKAEHTNRM